MEERLSRIQTQKLYVRIDGGPEVTIYGRSTVGDNWAVGGEISFTAVAFSKEAAAPFIVNLRGKRVRLERSLDVKTGTIITQKFEETPMLTGFCYILRVTIRLEEETGISQKQSNGEVAFRG